MYFKRLLGVVVFTLLLCFEAKADELESLEIKANACEKAFANESLSSARVRAVDKAVFLGIKNLPELESDRMTLNEHDLNVMIYRLVDDFVEDLSSKVLKSEDEKVCVEIKGYINPLHINEVRKEFDLRRQSTDSTEELLEEIAQNVNDAFAVHPQNLEGVALVYVEPLVYYNGKISHKHANNLKEKIKDNPYYFLTDDKELADIKVTPKLLKAKVDALDETHKRFQMVVSLEVSGLKDAPTVISQNRFLLFDASEDEQEIAGRLLDKLLEAAGADLIRRIERFVQEKIEKESIGRTI